MKNIRKKISACFLMVFMIAGILNTGERIHVVKAAETFKIHLNTRQENKYSIVTKIVYGCNSFLMTGDAQKETIQKIAAKGLH